MFELLKKLLPVAENIGAVLTVKQTNNRDRQYFSSDEIDITGVLADGREFRICLEVADKKPVEQADGNS